MTTENLMKLSREQKILFIAKTCETIISNPEKELRRAQNILNLMKQSDFMVIKMSTLSLTELFKDLAPMYLLDKKGIEENLVKVIKKEERKVVTFEHQLLIFYENFFRQLNMLNQHLSELKRRERR